MAFAYFESSDPQTVVANLALHSAAVQHAVNASMRRAAQYTATTTKRRVNAKTGAPQKLYKKQILWFTRKFQGAQEVPTYYKVWMGEKYRVGADEFPKGRREAKARGAFYAPKFGKGLFLRDELTGKRHRVYAFSLKDFEEDMARIARIGSKRIYRQRLKTELRTRSKRVKSPAEAQALMRAWRATARAQTNVEVFN